MIHFCCVWQGDKYGFDYVERLRSMIARHYSHPFAFDCYTDRVGLMADNITMYPIANLRLPGWWGKMAVFIPLVEDARRIFFDLDTVIVGSLEPLASYNGRFAICENFTKRAGHPNWPCNYGSCVMSLPPNWGFDVWRRFDDDRDYYLQAGFARFGDQMAIEKLAPGATYLQDVTPTGYFTGYRDLTAVQPEGCAIVIFAGSHKPDNCPHRWIKDAWR